MQQIILFLTTMVTLFVIDMIWLGLIAKQIYETQIGTLLRKSGTAMTPIWPAALLVYVLMAMGIVYFVLPRANGHYSQALITGALFGAVVYGIYDFTNYSILANWPLRITIIDFLWGITLCSLSSFIIAFINNNFLKG